MRPQVIGRVARQTATVTTVDEFSYELPDSAIAQQPIEPRDAARLLDAIGADEPPRDRQVRDLPSLLRDGDVLVVNDTRVINARLHLRKVTGGAVEVMLVEPIEATTAWLALVRPGRRVAPGTVLQDDLGEPVVVVGEDNGDGLRLISPVGATDLSMLAERVGQVPLPPYITQSLADGERYQTVYSRTPGSVAAPTAGLHFTPELLDRCTAAGATVLSVELIVGLGTFRPILVEELDDHRMHAERFRVAPEVLDACAQADRVIAVGTTTVRALESAATLGRNDGSTELFIQPGYDFQVVDVLLTNFHQPRSSLLVMLAAFCGERWRDVYAAALDNEYRFLSFGDAMIVDRGR